MPPRTAATAVEADQCPSLNLIMEKGPLSGQTNYFRPRARVRIGRVVRGNSLTIEDAGISPKHLIIQAEPISDGRRHWTVSDLGSSNGTFLNGQRLQPSEPAALSDGDVLTIGEQTSIKVRFEDCAGEAEVSSTRNLRRGVSKQVGKLGAVGVERATGRQTRGSKAKELENGSKGKIQGVEKKSKNLIIILDDDEEEKNRSTSGVKEGQVEAGNGEVVVELEKMTLGEWFQYLEAYLTKQIVDETEQMITEMRRDAERVHEYRLQKKKNICNEKRVMI